MSEQQTPVTIFRKDYTPFSHDVESVALHFELEGSRTTVRSTLKLRARGEQRSLRLDGNELELVSVELDGRPLSAAEYQLDEESLTLETPEQCELVITTAVEPARWKVCINPAATSAPSVRQRVFGVSPSIRIAPMC